MHFAMRYVSQPPCGGRRKGQGRQRDKLGLNWLLNTQTFEFVNRLIVVDILPSRRDWKNTAFIFEFVFVCFLFNHRTMVQNSQESRQYWATRSSLCLFARTTHSFACSHCSLNCFLAHPLPSWLEIVWLDGYFCSVLFLFWPIVHRERTTFSPLCLRLFT